MNLLQLHIVGSIPVWALILVLSVFIIGIMIGIGILGSEIALYAGLIGLIIVAVLIAIMSVSLNVDNIQPIEQTYCACVNSDSYAPTGGNHTIGKSKQCGVIVSSDHD